MWPFKKKISKEEAVRFLGNSILETNGMMLPVSFSTGGAVKPTFKVAVIGLKFDDYEIAGFGYTLPRAKASLSRTIKDIIDYGEENTFAKYIALEKEGVSCKRGDR